MSILIHWYFEWTQNGIVFEYIVVVICQLKIFQLIAFLLQQPANCGGDLFSWTFINDAIKNDKV